MLAGGDKVYIGASMALFIYIIIGVLLVVRQYK